MKKLKSILNKKALVAALALTGFTSTGFGSNEAWANPGSWDAMQKTLAKMLLNPKEFPILAKALRGATVNAIDSNQSIPVTESVLRSAFVDAWNAVFATKAFSASGAGQDLWISKTVSGVTALDSGGTETGSAKKTIQTISVGTAAAAGQLALGGTSTTPLITSDQAVYLYNLIAYGTTGSAFTANTLGAVLANLTKDTASTTSQNNASNAIEGALAPAGSKKMVNAVAAFTNEVIDTFRNTLVTKIIASSSTNAPVVKCEVAKAILGDFDSLAVPLTQTDLSTIHSAANASLSTFTAGGGFTAAGDAKAALLAAMESARSTASGKISLTALLGAVEDTDTFGSGPAVTFSALFTDADERNAYRNSIKEQMVAFVRTNKIAANLVPNSDAASFAQNAVIAGLGGTAATTKVAADAKYQAAKTVLGDFDSLVVPLTQPQLSTIHTAATASLSAFAAGGGFNDSSAKAALLAAMENARSIASGNISSATLLGAVEDTDTFGTPATAFSALFTNADERNAYRASIRRGLFDLVNADKLLVTEANAAKAVKPAGAGETQITSLKSALDAVYAPISGSANYAAKLTGTSGYVFAASTGGANVVLDTAVTALVNQAGVGGTAASSVRGALDALYVNETDFASQFTTSGTGSMRTALDTIYAKTAALQSYGLASLGSNAATTALSGLDKDVAGIVSQKMTVAATGGAANASTGSLTVFKMAKKLITEAEINAASNATDRS